MKKIIFCVSVMLTSCCFGQVITKEGLIIGEGVRIRNKASASGKEVSKVHGMRTVTILEESQHWDGLDKDDICEKHKWVKVKWEGDSTGWVYGKYCFKNNESTGLLTKETSFELQGNSYTVCIFSNYRYPIGDDNGLTGCGDVERVMIYDTQTKIYHPIKDTRSKENESILVFYDNEGMGENIKNISVKNQQVTINVEISYQEGSATSVYIIQKNGGLFEVVNYKKSEVKY